MKTKFILLAITILLSFSCSKTYKAPLSEDISESPVMEAMKTSDEGVNVSTNEQVPVQKHPEKIIKDADIRFQVKDYGSARSQLDSLIRKYSAFITKEAEVRNNYEISNTIVIRISNIKFDDFINDIGTIPGKFDYKNINAHDVTEEYIDIEARLKTKREVEARYYDILKKANKIEDILKVENEIRLIREEIESAEGRLKYINDRVSFSTITLSIYQQIEYKYKPNPEPNFFERLLKALHTGWKGLLSFIIALFYLWPFLILLVAGWYTIRYFRKRKRSNKP